MKRAFQIGVTVTLGTLVCSALLYLFFPQQVLSVLRIPAHELIVRDAERKTHYVVVMLGGERSDRTDLAARIILEKFSEKILFCDGYHPTVFPTVPDYATWEGRGFEYRAQVIEKGIRETQIEMIPCEGIYDSSSEINEIAKFLRKAGEKSVNVATSAAHSRRVRIIWNRLAPDIKAQVIGAKDFHFDSWWREKRSLRVLLYEYGALGKELLRRVYHSLLGSGSTDGKV
ncbi:MAG: YdcF family protein [Bdellovibrionales bacterium]|nr:YdcF family protein [Bdellovibrionales bacterium]